MGPEQLVQLCDSEPEMQSESAAHQPHPGAAAHTSGSVRAVQSGQQSPGPNVVRVTFTPSRSRFRSISNIAGMDWHPQPWSVTKRHLSWVVHSPHEEICSQKNWHGSARYCMTVHALVTEKWYASVAKLVWL